MPVRSATTRSRLLAIALLAAAAPQPARAGLIAAVEERGVPATITTEGKRLRVEQGGLEPSLLIFDGEAQRLYQLDPARRVYSEMTQADAKALAEQMERLLRQLKPEERAKVQARLARRRSADQERRVEYAPLGRSASVLGMPCQVYRVSRSGQPDEEGCFIPWGEKTVRRDDMEALVEMGRFMERFMAIAYAAGGEARGGFHFAEEMERAPGFPALVEVVGEDGKRNTELQLVGLVRAPVPPDRFAVPAGFGKVPLPGLETAVGGRPGP